MNKKSVAFAFILLLSISAVPFFDVLMRAVAAPATVDTVITKDAVREGYMRKGFYAEGLFWAFYSDGINAGWEFSADGTTWTGAFTSIGACTSGYYFSIFFDGTYVHYARYNAYDLFYRRGTPVNDGTITWSAAEQLVYDGSAGNLYDYPSIAVDTNGYAWIGAYNDQPDEDDFPVVLKNADNDGTWTTDFAYELSAVDDTTWRVAPVPLNDGKVYVVYCRSGAAPLGKLYAAGWGSEESDLADYAIGTNRYFSAVAIGDNVHFVYNRMTTNQIRHNERVWGVGWKEVDMLVQDTVTFSTGPALSADPSEGTLYCFWTSTATDHVYYKKYDVGWDIVATDWIDESTDDIPNDDLISSFYMDHTGRVGLFYITSTTPYKVRFAFLKTFFPVNDACDSTPVFIENTYGWVNVTVSDPDGVADLATVDIKVDTIGAAETFTLRWTQSSGVFSEVSDTSGICTLDAATSVRINIDADTDQICFYFKITGGTTGYCDVRVTSIDDGALQDVDTFSNEFLYRLTWIASLDITNLDTDDWVFEGNKRYEFQVDYYNETLSTVNQFGIRFIDSTNQTHIIWYNKTAKTLTVTSHEDGISGWLHSLTQVGTNATAIFHIMFNNPIPDTYNVQVEIRVTADNIDSGWITPSGDIFSIYNLGGLATLTASGTAGRIVGGDVFELYAANGGLAKATILFNKLQHWSMDYDFYIEDGETYAQGPSATPDPDYSNYGYVELGWDVMLDETWVNDFLVAKVNITDGWFTATKDWIKYNVSWYNQGVHVKNNSLYGLFEGYSIFEGENKDTSGFHWDIWFNRANASTIVGARVNTEYYGMSDVSPWWAIWGSEWKPMRTEVSESSVFVNLEDAIGTLHSAKDVGFIRSWIKVYRIAAETFTYEVRNIGALSFMVARDTMSGVDAPAVRETRVPDVMSGWLGSALGGIFAAALKNLSNTLASFGIGFFTVSVIFVDAVFAALGYPALVSLIFEWMAALFASVPALVSYGLTMIGQVFRLITVSASDTLDQLTSIITIWINMYGIVKSFLGETFTPGINLWNDLGGNSFIQIGAVLYPLWLLMMAADKGTQAVINHLSGVLNIGSFFLNFILNVTEFFTGLLRGLIGAIRG